MDKDMLLERTNKLANNLAKVIRGKNNIISLLITALAADGNVLLEDVPGVGKTTLAKALAASLNCQFTRIQFTPDLLPADIIGSSIYNPQDGSFKFRGGPVFSNILLADEINRASPRTQSALLEAMSERQISTEGRTIPLPRPFLVIATENPVEYQGTYQLPEAQLDRFAMQLTLGYPDEENELDMLFGRLSEDPELTIEAVMDTAEVIDLQSAVRQVKVENSVADYMLRLIRATRSDSRITLGASPRALLTLSRCAQAAAFLKKRDFVLPEDVKEIAAVVLPHRLMLDNKSRYSGMTAAQIVSDLLENIKVPV
ncbi:MAG: MoxR family ATPase [Victivallaceae bacterium]|nr:MoxR family ATPase [Victivallaceae bacterium]MDD4318223.1 MoxR family ATPase [Victivallaceae bacterium]